MKAVGLWTARLALVIVIVAAAWGVLDPGFTAEKFRVRQDQVVHALVVYLLTTLAIPALPHVKPLLIGAAVLAVAVLLEYAQQNGLVPGAFQHADLYADLVGVSAALLPILLFQARRGR